LVAASCNNVVSTDMTWPKPLLARVVGSVADASTLAGALMPVGCARCCAGAIHDAAHAAIANTMEALRIGVLLELTLAGYAKGFAAAVKPHRAG
jgi:hypothetical protein